MGFVWTRDLDVGLRVFRVQGVVLSKAADREGLKLF